MSLAGPRPETIEGALDIATDKPEEKRETRKIRKDGEGMKSRELLEEDVQKTVPTTPTLTADPVREHGDGRRVFSDDPHSSTLFYLL